MVRADYEKLFSHLKTPEPPAEFAKVIMSRISAEEGFLSALKRVVLFFLCSFASGWVCIPVIAVVRSQFEQSGFSQFASLLFSNFGDVFAHWHEFALALLESLPAQSMLMILATLLALIWSLLQFAAALKRFSLSRRFIIN